jgi:hypothetical protein
MMGSKLKIITLLIEIVSFWRLNEIVLSPQKKPRFTFPAKNSIYTSVATAVEEGRIEFHISNAIV